MYNSKYSDVPEAQVVNELKFEPGKTPADIMLRIDALKKKNFASSLIDQNKKTTYGAMIGFGSGFLVALFYKQNKLLFTLAGTLAGGLVGWAISTMDNYKTTKPNGSNTGTISSK